MSTAVPYTTLFRSAAVGNQPGLWEFPKRALRHTGYGNVGYKNTGAFIDYYRQQRVHCVNPSRDTRRRWLRSEEHTSELQSRGQLVCRLLLEKNKIKSAPKGGACAEGAPDCATAGCLPPPRWERVAGVDGDADCAMPQRKQGREEGHEVRNAT